MDNRAALATTLAVLTVIWLFRILVRAGAFTSLVLEKDAVLGPFLAIYDIHVVSKIGT